MSTDQTQRQSADERQQATDLSLQSTSPPAVVEGYESQRLLGRGAFGEVWVGVDRNTGRQVAIKFYNQRSRLDWTLLTREVEKLVFLSADRYVVQLLDVGWESDPPYYVMEYVERGSLEDLLQEHGPLPVADAVEMFRGIATGVMHAHGKGVLHCDLKPANVLVDQDHKPRLADFGQSRLSHEQSPALGTLFYMAPEQADLDAVPDARWDVYALGALLYCLLTGAPPYRDERFLAKLNEAEDLAQRLAIYRRMLRSSPPPLLHRKPRGVDRRLSEIIERCLAIDPQRRFPNVQTVLDVLDTRDASRVRNPLVFLGFVGPVLLLLIMGSFGLRGYESAVNDSQDFISQRARQSNQFAAEFAARSLEGEVARYFQLIRQEADDPDFVRLFAATAELDLVQQINDRNQRGESIEALQTEFIQQPTRDELNQHLDRRLEFFLDKLRHDQRELKLASFLAVDNRGRMLAVAYDHNRPSKSIGWCYAHRTYFHGGAADLQFEDDLPAYEQVPEQVTPIESTHFSAAFPSTTTGLWKVAVSTPIYRDGDPTQDVIGVLGLTVNLGDFFYFRSKVPEDRFAVLIDGRQGPNRGVILQHPLFDQMARAGEGPSANYSTTEYRVTDDQLLYLKTEPLYRYQDPLSQAPDGATYGGDWIAAIENIPLPSAPPQSEDMFVLVQERFSDAVAPVKRLGYQLKQEGLWALGGVIAVTLVLWYIVIRMLSEPSMVLNRRPAAPSSPTSSPTPVHNLTTLEARDR
jgi:hypothetical protein